MECGNCNHDLGGLEARKAFLRIDVMGDEYIYSYWQCEACGFYTAETCRDRSPVPEIISRSGPIDREQGDEIVSLIGRCPDPGDKRCGCAVHRRLDPQGVREDRHRESGEDSPGTGEVAENRDSGSLRIECPICSVPTDSLKRYGVMCEVVFLGIVARSRRCAYTACPRCMRRMVLKDTFSPVNILLANLMWVLAVLPYSLALVIASTIPGHSRSIREMLSRSTS